ncbi:hypothetical protein GCM10009678_29410 [Actinomadura kijaniata]
MDIMSAQRGAAGPGDQAAVRANTVQGLQEQFPGVRVWYGEATRAWWALVPSANGPRLVEAPTPQLLRDAIINARSQG